MQDIVPVRRAVVSVYDKTGLSDFIGSLGRVDIFSSGGTAAHLREAGYTVTDIAEYTSFPPSPGHLVVSLHPLIHGGILLDPRLEGEYRNPRGEFESHRAYMEQHGILPIDLVVVNFYPFEKTVAAGALPETAREQIDIGGPTMIRAAAKTFTRVTPVVDRYDYFSILRAIKKQGGIPLSLRFSLARKAFRRIAEYDGAIARYYDHLGFEDVEEAYGISPDSTAVPEP